MSWVKENCVSFFQLFCIKVVKTGRVPQHIAFIMDGNRRYAKKHSVKCSAGHSKGFDKLSETLKWCLDLGIPEVTVYAFSIENFKRSEEEVKGLMDLARDKFQRLLDEIKQINEWGVQVQVAGRLSLLPEDLRKLVAKAMLATRDNNKLRLNIAYAYTGRDEISRAATHILNGVSQGRLTADDVDEGLMSQSMDLGEPELLVRTSGEVRLSDFMLWQVPSFCDRIVLDGVTQGRLTADNVDEDLMSQSMDLGEPELLVRTSGEVRLSDFVLWQISTTVLYFTDVLWPEFTIWNLLTAIIHFQRHAPPPKDDDTMSETKQSFLDNLEAVKWRDLDLLVNS